MSEHVHEVYRKKGVRLSAEMSPLLYKYFYAPMKGKAWKGFHMFDKAHTVMLVEEGLLTPAAGAAILTGLRRMESEGVVETRARVGGAQLLSTPLPSSISWLLAHRTRQLVSRRCHAR